jgi:Ca2+-binding EF-hand superfamily protein
MTSSTTRLLAFVATATVLAGCGTNARLTSAPHAASSLQAQAKKVAPAPILKEDPNDPTHAAMNAIVKDVLGGMFASLLQDTDTNKDGAISRDEYAANHSNDAAWLFQATFDTNRDGTITQAEYDAAMATGAPVDAYHHFTESTMEKAITPYMADKNFNAQKLRTYMTTDLGLTADWPQIFKLMTALDLNKDGKVLSGPGEGPAFMLTFARAQMQHALSMPVSAL